MHIPRVRVVLLPGPWLPLRDQVQVRRDLKGQRGTLLGRPDCPRGDHGARGGLQGTARAQGKQTLDASPTAPE
jgi:hypothetical protein